MTGGGLPLIGQFRGRGRVSYKENELPCVCEREIYITLVLAVVVGELLLHGESGGRPRFHRVHSEVSGSGGSVH